MAFALSIGQVHRDRPQSLLPARHPAAREPAARRAGAEAHAAQPLPLAGRARRGGARRLRGRGRATAGGAALLRRALAAARGCRRRARRDPRRRPRHDHRAAEEPNRPRAPPPAQRARGRNPTVQVVGQVNDRLLSNLQRQRMRLQSTQHVDPGRWIARDELPHSADSSLYLASLVRPLSRPFPPLGPHPLPARLRYRLSGVHRHRGRRTRGTQARVETETATRPPSRFAGRGALAAGGHRTATKNSLGNGSRTVPSGSAG